MKFLLKSLKKLMPESNISKKLPNLKFNTYEFIDIKDWCYTVSNITKLFQEKRTWIKFSKDKKIKLKKPDYYQDKTSLDILLSHKTVGMRLKDLIKGRKIIGSKIAHLDNVFIQDDKIPIFLKPNLALTESYGSSEWLNFQLNKWNDKNNYKESKIYIKKKKYLHTRVKLLQIDKEKKVKYINRGILLSSVNDNNFFHWIFDTLSKMKLIKLSKEFEKIPIIIRSKPNKYQKELLKIFKIKNKIITTNKKDIFIKDLYFPSLPSPPIYDLDTINWIREIFLNHQIKKSSFPSSKRIYISREDASHRKVRNCSKIYAYLKDLGFTKHILSKISIDEQIELFKNAEIVVMPHGSNCLHMVYAPKKCKFIEFQSPSQINNMFACMSLILKQKYGFLIGKNEDRNNNYDISLKNLEKIMQKVL
tara:strand:- start:108 stop:1364 length:1257 start_codon:yes stop_codon:yes gene_type:complete